MLSVWELEGTQCEYHFQRQTQVLLRYSKSGRVCSYMGPDAHIGTYSENITNTCDHFSLLLVQSHVKKPDQCGLVYDQRPVFCLFVSV